MALVEERTLADLYIARPLFRPEFLSMFQTVDRSYKGTPQA